MNPTGRGTCSPPRLVLLPGMGVDGRLFEPQRAVSSCLEVPAWIEPRTGEPLADYARRFAATIGSNGNLFLGGVSFGGMVALEMARHLRPRAVFLIASCRTGRHIRPALRLVERSLRRFPTPVLRWLRLPSARFVAWRNGLRGEHARWLVDMAREASIDFLRWAGPAALAWPGPPEGAIPCPVHRIHGARDPLIPLASGDAEVVIPDGQHIINLTHAEEVNAFLRRWMDEATRSPDRNALPG